MKLLRTALTLGSVLGAREAIKGLEHVDLNHALGVFGLERRPHALERALPVVGLLALGAAVGAGAALLLAPSSGKELRSRISGRIGEARHELGERFREYEREHQLASSERR